MPGLLALAVKGRVIKCWCGSGFLL